MSIHNDPRFGLSRYPGAPWPLPSNAVAAPQAASSATTPQEPQQPLPPSPPSPRQIIAQEQQRLEEAKYAFTPEEQAKAAEFNAQRARENASYEAELAGLDAQIAQERAAHPGQESRKLKGLLRARDEVAGKIKPPIDLNQITSEVEAVMNDSGLGDKEKKRALEDLRNKYGLPKRGDPISMNDTFTGRLARLTKESMGRLDEARKAGERMIDAQIREAERIHGRNSPEVRALQAEKKTLSTSYREQHSFLSSIEKFLHRSFKKKKRGLFARIASAFKKIGRGIASAFKSGFKALASLGKGLFNGAKALFRGDLKGAFRAVATGIKDTVHHTFQALRAAVPVVTQLIPGMAVLSLALPKVGNFVEKIQQGFIDSAASIAQGVVKTWTSLGEGVLNGASALARGDVKGAFKAVARGTKEAAVSGWKAFNEALPYLVTAACFVPGLNAVAIPLRLAMAARDLANAIRSKDALGIVGAVADGVAGGAAGRGLKLVTRAADMVGNGVSAAYGAQAAARGDALGAVAGLAGAASGARGPLGQAAGQVSMGASLGQAGMAGDSAGVSQAAAGLASSRRGQPRHRFEADSADGAPPAASRSPPRGLPTPSAPPRPLSREVSRMEVSRMEVQPPRDRLVTLEAPVIHRAERVGMAPSELEAMLKAHKADLDKGLTPNAKAALEHARKVSAQQELTARQAVIDRLKPLHPRAAAAGDAAYEACVKYLAQADLTINVHTAFLDSLFKDDGAYLNMWERSGYGGDKVYAQSREDTEMSLHRLPPMEQSLGNWSKDGQGKWSDAGRKDRLFAGHALPENKARVTSLPTDRPHSAALNIALHVAGAAVNPIYGTSHIVLRDDVKKRSTLTGGDSLEDTWKKSRAAGVSPDTRVGTLENPGVVMQHLHDSTFKVLAQNALDPTGAEPRRVSGQKVSFPYIEAQVFGGIKISRDVAKLVIDENDLALWQQGRYPNPRNLQECLPARDTAQLKQRLERFCQQHQIELEFIQTGEKQVINGMVFFNEPAKGTAMVPPLVFQGRKVADLAARGQWDKVAQLCGGLSVPPVPPKQFSVMGEAPSLAAIRKLATEAEKSRDLFLAGRQSPDSPSPTLAVRKLGEQLGEHLATYGHELGRGPQGQLLQRTLAHLEQLSRHLDRQTR